MVHNAKVIWKFWSWFFKVKLVAYSGYQYTYNIHLPWTVWYIPVSRELVLLLGCLEITNG